MKGFTWIMVLSALVAVVFFRNAAVPAKANLAALISLQELVKPELISQNGRKALIAKVYSTYPFNNRSVLTIAAGKEDGLAPGMAVTVDGNYLLGQVEDVFDRFSTIRTIFDSDWQISVRIGSGEADALLVSGSRPELAMIDRKSAVQSGDMVFSASRDFPYGMKIGTIEDVREDDISFLRGALGVPYQLNVIKEVAVIIR